MCKIKIGTKITYVILLKSSGSWAMNVQSNSHEMSATLGTLLIKYGVNSFIGNKAKNKNEVCAKYFLQ